MYEGKEAEKDEKKNNSPQNLIFDSFFHLPVILHLCKKILFIYIKIHKLCTDIHIYLCLDEPNIGIQNIN